MEPSESLVALVDMGLYGKALAIGLRLQPVVGSRLPVVDDIDNRASKTDSQANAVLQWFDGRELHLVRGRVVPETVRRRSFEFERVGDRQVIKFTELDGEMFESLFREQYPEAPRDASGAEIRAWLVENHGLWKTLPGG